VVSLICLVFLVSTQLSHPYINSGIATDLYILVLVSFLRLLFHVVLFKYPDILLVLFAWFLMLSVCCYFLCLFQNILILIICSACVPSISAFGIQSLKYICHSDSDILVTLMYLFICFPFD
jgi:hypothetical protein